MATGTVKWYNSQKGYGFIAPSDGGKDIFVHVSALQEANLSELADNQNISYELVEQNGRTSASDLKLED